MFSKSYIPKKNKMPYNLKQKEYLLGMVHKK